MMVLARMKAQQSALSRAARFVKTRLIPYENLPGVTYEQTYDSFRNSFRLPTSFQEFIEEAPALYRRTIDYANKRDWAGLQSICSQSAAESLQTLFDNSRGKLQFSSEVLRMRQAYMHDVSLLSDDLYKRTFEVPRPLLNPAGASSAGPVSETCPSCFFLLFSLYIMYMHTCRILLLNRNYIQINQLCILHTLPNSKKHTKLDT